MPELTTEQLKGKGNEAFKEGDSQRAVEYYTQALQLVCGDESGERNEGDAEARKAKAALYKNRAMALLKLGDYESAERDCDRALECGPADAKAHYRRALARQKLDKLGSAFNDANTALRLQPGDGAIQELCSTLCRENAERLKQMNSLESRVSDMMRLSLCPGVEAQNADQRTTAMNNLLVLCRESEAGATRVWKEGRIVGELYALMCDVGGCADELALCATRVLDELAKRRQRAMNIIDELGIPKLARLPALRPSASANVEAAATVIQRAFNALGGMDHSNDVKPDEELVERNKLLIVRLILELEEILTDAAYPAAVREITMGVLLRNLMHMDGGLPRGWSWRFVEERGLLKLLCVACQIPEQCDFPVTVETRQHVAIFLTRLYDDMVFDQRRANFKGKVDQVFSALLADIDKEVPKNRLKLAALLITLLSGPVDTGINLVASDAVMKMMLEMASAEDPLQQSVAVELINLTVSKHERATALIKHGMPVLRKLFNSTDHNVKVRALVGLCKCAAAGGDDCSRATMDEDALLKLASTCKKILLDINKYSADVRRFACEGLSYLSLDAEVKEYIVGDPLLLQALVVLAKNAGAMCVFALSTIYVNLCNAYDKPKIEEEMVKLAQFAKHHVPETHPKDTDEYVEKRIRSLVEDGAVTACVAVSKTESKNALDNLARCVSAFCSDGKLVGQIISEGGAKLLLTLYKMCTPDGKLKAAHGLARLGTHSNPEIAFPGQRSFEVVKPMADLLHPDVDGRANYDALLTLTNLASISDALRKRILKEKVIPRVDEFWFDTSHELLRAAAAELLVNMLYNEDYFKEIAKPGSDRLKLWLLYCAEGEDRLQMASSGGFALLTEDEGVCQRVLEEIKSWNELLPELAMSEHPEVQRRCLMAIANMVASSEKVASELMATGLLRVLVAITKLDAPGRGGAKEQAQRALDSAEKYGIIKATDKQLYELRQQSARPDDKPLPTIEEDRRQ